MGKKFSILFIFIFSLTKLYAQSQRTKLDSIGRENPTINEVMLIKDAQQSQIDSLVGIQLKKQLAAAQGDQVRTKALEAKLYEIKRSDSIRSIQQTAEISRLKQHAKGYPVTLNHDTLFTLYTRTGSFNAAERAVAISRKIEMLYQDAFYSADSLQIRSSANNYDLVYKNEEIILSVANLDGLWFGKSNAQLSKEYLAIIRKAIQNEREAHSLTNWLKRIGLCLLIMLAVYLLVRAVAWLFSKSRTYVQLRSRRVINGLKLGKLKVLAAKDLEIFLVKLNNFVQIITTCLIIYLSLPLLFSVFPETEGYTNTLLGWVLGPLKAAMAGVLTYLPNLFTIGVIFLIFRFGLKAVRYFFLEIGKGNIVLNGFHADWAIPTFNILRFILYAFMLVIVFPYLPGSGSAAFQGVSVFLGILISLGSSSAITNIVAGLVITYMRPFKKGDRVKIGEVTGDIIEKTMLVTRIRTIKNEDVTVPNSMVLSSSTVNYSAQAQHLGLIIHYEVTLGYDVPWKQAYALLIEAASKTEHVLSQPAPFVLQTQLNDYYVSYQINAYTEEANKQALIYSSLMENIQDALAKAGIELLSPTYNVIRKE